MNKKTQRHIGVPTKRFKQNYLRKLHRELSWKHEEQVRNSKVVGCFCCMRIFPPEEIGLWMEEYSGGRTAWCPYCDMDTILPDCWPQYPHITKRLLIAMHDRYCSWY